MPVYGEILVSIIVPIYNVEDYLKRCVDSIKRQTHQNLEIILVDDGSTDLCPQICDDFAKMDSRIVVIHQENQGSGSARNAGIHIARGEWICFVDSDDYISPHFVGRLLKIAMDNGCLTVQCCFQRVLEDINQSGSFQSEIKVMDWRSYFIYVYNNMCGNTIGSFGHTPFGAVINIYHISLFNGIRFSSLRVSEDIEFIPRIIYTAGTKKIAVTDEILYYYYQRQGSKSKSKASLALADRFYALNLATSFFIEKKEDEVHRLFHRTLFECIVRDYLILCAELPEEHDKYRFLKEEITKNLCIAQEYCYEQIVLQSGARKTWETVLKNIKDCVIYGYGDWGKEFVYWLRYFGINILEIWDQKAGIDSYVEKIPLKEAHSGLDKNTCIIIAIGNSYVSLEVRCDLHELGYRNIYDWRMIESGLKYGKYTKFLPLIVESYRGLLHE